MKKVFVIILPIILLLVGAYSFHQYNRKPQGVYKTPPAYSLTSDDLYQEYVYDESKADQKYRGKVIAISGLVEEVNSNKDVMTVVLHAPEYPIGGVSCTMAEYYPDIEIGQIVQLKGECQGMLMQVIINKSILVQ